MSSTSSSDVESGESLAGTEREAGAAVPSVDGVDESANIPRRKLRQRLHDWVDETIDGFKEHDRSRQEAAYGATGNPPLHKNLKTIQMQFIAFGGAIGTGLFVGCGQALAAGGPGSLLLGFLIIGLDLLCTIYSLAEMTLVLPISGAFVIHATRFINKPWGFAMGWNYATQWLMVLPLELVALTIVFKYWHAVDKVTSAGLALIFWLIIIIINLFGVRGYGEAEMLFAILKIIAVVGFFVLGVAIDLGAGKTGTHIGGKYWHDPGAFTGGWCGFFTVLVIAAFSFSGTEMLCLAAGEHPKPIKVLPKAVKQVFWRIFLFYTLSIIIVGLVVPHTDPRLIENSGDANARASPFVIAIKNSGIPVLDSILNTVILITALSVGNTSVYASTRVLVALSVQHQAPKILSYIDRKGRPQFALLVAFIVGLLSILSQLRDNNAVFTWLLALSGLSSIITWGSICLAHIRFRKACDAQKLTERLPYKSPFGIWGSYIGLFINCGVIVGQFAQVILAVEWSHVSTSGQMELSWSYFFAIPLFALCYWAYVVYERWSGEMETMDLTTGTKFLRPGRRRHHVVKGAWWKNVYDVLCC